MRPIITDRGLFAFLIPSPKRHDLRWDPRYAMHSFPAEDNDDAFYLTGTAQLVADGAAREMIAAQFLSEEIGSALPTASRPREVWEFTVARCLHTGNHRARRSAPAPQDLAAP